MGNKAAWTLAGLLVVMGGLFPVFKRTADTARLRDRTARFIAGWDARDVALVRRHLDADLEELMVRRGGTLRGALDAGVALRMVGSEGVRLEPAPVMGRMRARTGGNPELVWHRHGRQWLLGAENLTVLCPPR